MASQNAAFRYVFETYLASGGDNFNGFIELMAIVVILNYLKKEMLMVKKLTFIIFELV
jgi:hypothetical protein